MYKRVIFHNMHYCVYLKMHTKFPVTKTFLSNVLLGSVVSFLKCKRDGNIFIDMHSGSSQKMLSRWLQKMNFRDNTWVLLIKCPPDVSRQYFLSYTHVIFPMHTSLVDKINFHVPKFSLDANGKIFVENIKLEVNFKMPTR